MKYEVTDWELGGAKTVIEAQGIAEAMLDYLPWPSLEIEITLQPSKGIAVVVDRQTDSRYHVQTK